MAVFFSCGDGDIYGGETKEAVIAAMQADYDHVDLETIREWLGATRIQAFDEHCVHNGEYTTLVEEYDESQGAQGLASDWQVEGFIE